MGSFTVPDRFYKPSDGEYKWLERVNQNWDSIQAKFNTLEVGGGSRDYVSVKDHGVTGDGSTDDTDALQTIISSTASGFLYFPLGDYKISDTLLVENYNIQLVGPGSQLIWAGSAGVPMVRFHNVFGGGIEGLILIGNASAKPSSAISIYGTSGGGPSGLAFRDIRLGTIGATSEFTNGISWDGSNLNADRNSFENFLIYGCTGHGVDLALTQAVDNTFEGIHIKNTAIAWYILANCSIRGTQCLNSSTSDFYVDQNATASVEGFHSEGAARFIQQRTSASLEVRNGIWHAGANIAGDGIIVDCVDNTRTRTTLKQVSFYADGSYAGPTPKISVHASAAAASKKVLRLENVRGFINGNGNALSFTPANLDLTPATSTDEIVLYADMTDLHGPTVYAYASIYTGTSTTSLFGGSADFARISADQGGLLINGDFALSAGWGSTASISHSGGATDMRFRVSPTAGGTGIVANPTITLTFHDGAWSAAPIYVVSRVDLNAPTTGWWAVSSVSTTQVVFTFVGTPVSGSQYSLDAICLG